MTTRTGIRAAMQAALAATTLGMAAIAAHAAPILYTMTFDASNAAAGALGPSGTGSFLYDSAAPGTMTGFNWNLGPGLSGGITDAYFLLPAITGNTAEFMFSSVLGNLAGDPSTNGASVGPPEGSGYYVAPFPNVIAEFCWGTSEPGSCGMTNSGTSLAAYEFVERGVTGALFAYRGYVSIATSTVPEPGSLALVALGLVACCLSVRRGQND